MNHILLHLAAIATMGTALYFSHERKGIVLAIVFVGYCIIISNAKAIYGY